MCGIVTVSLTKYFENTEENRHKFGKVLKTLLVLNEERGYDAAGIVSLKDQMENSIEKIEHRMYKLLIEKFPTNEIEELFVDAKHIICHSRALTVGVNEKYNTHPIIINKDGERTLFGVHNGTIINKDVFENEMTENSNRKYSDSVVIFQKLEASKNHEETIDILSRIRGAATLLWANKAEDFNTLHIFKYERPLTIWYWDGLIFCSSDWDYLYKAKYLNSDIFSEYNITEIPIVDNVKIGIDISKKREEIFLAPERCV